MWKQWYVEELDVVKLSTDSRQIELFMEGQKGMAIIQSILDGRCMSGAKWQHTFATYMFILGVYVCYT